VAEGEVFSADEAVTLVREFADYVEGGSKVARVGRDDATSGGGSGGGVSAITTTTTIAILYTTTTIVIVAATTTTLRFGRLG
jgi:hypothetical protein